MVNKDLLINNFLYVGEDRYPNFWEVEYVGENFLYKYFSPSYFFRQHISPTTALKLNLGYQICLEDFGFVELIVVNLVLELVVNFVVQVLFAQVSFGQTQRVPANVTR